jgi:hypothetical protein
MLRALIAPLLGRKTWLRVPIKRESAPTTAGMRSLSMRGRAKVGQRTACAKGRMPSALDACGASLRGSRRAPPGVLREADRRGARSGIEDGIPGAWFLLSTPQDVQRDRELPCPIKPLVAWAREGVELHPSRGSTRKLQWHTESFIGSLQRRRSNTRHRLQSSCHRGNRPSRVPRGRHRARRALTASERTG